MTRLREAFTLIELVVVVGIMALMAAILIPRLGQRTPQSEWPTILNDLNNLVFFARQEAISNQNIYRLTFKSNTKRAEGPTLDTITVEEEIDDPERPGKKTYRQVASDYFSTVYTFHETVKLKSVYHGRTDELEENRGTGYCYIIPEGLVQDVLVQITRKDRLAEVHASYSIEPFFGKFEFHEGLVRPEK